MSTKKNFVILGAVLLFSILIISSVSAGTSGVTSIWTTDGSCGDSSQDVNSYEVGHAVYINGNGVELTGLENWEIVGTPGSCDPGITIAYGTISAGWSSGSTTFCFDSYTVQAGDCGVYKVNVEGKNDNYQVVVGDGEITCTDSDGDGYYAEGGACGTLDCNDNNASIHPGAVEILCNLVDENCNGMGDDDKDADGDDYFFCINDCDDSNFNVNPGMTEITCNGIDDDCDPLTLDNPQGICDYVAECGNGILDQGEECDDGNLDNFDGCSSTCQFEQLGCLSDSQCSEDYYGDNYCFEGNVYHEFYDYYCSPSYTCALTQSSILVEGCAYGCETGICNSPPANLPTCTIDYIKDKVGSGYYYFTDTVYINYEGEFIVGGLANPNEDSCIISSVDYNRSSPLNYFHQWETANSLGGFFNPIEDWYSRSWEPVYVEGWHTICCQATSLSCEGSICSGTTTGPSNCEEFCVDITEPLQVTGVYHSNPSDCVSNYVNVAPEFSWNAVVDNGCAPIIYEVELHLSDGTLIDTYEVSETTFTVPSEELVNGQDYYVLVRAKDLAGNEGLWSVASSHVYYDTENPTVEITGQPWDVWYNSNFNVIETDSDNLGLYTCKYRILDGTTVTKDWTSISCGVDVSFLVDVSLYCETDGQDSCKIEKEVVDKACNVGTTYQTWDLDRQAPTTSKEVGTPKISPFGTWIDLLINGFFINDKTQITLSCEDQTDLSGCANTYYTIEFTPFNEDGTYGTKVLIGTYTYSSPFTLNNGDGLYEITYWSVDNAGNVEVSKSEVDKVDLYAPKTTMSFTGLVIQGLNYNSENFAFNVVMNFIKPSCDEEPTIIELAATDSEVGVDKTYYQILVPTTGEGIHNESYGTDTDMWYESEGACLNENDNCEITSWTLSTQFQDMLGDNCGDMPNWCEYNESQGVVFTEECDHKICYYSVDRLGNTEEVECTVFSVDGTGPDVTIWNPYEWLSGSIKSCGINLEITALDEKSGIENGEVTGIDYILKDSKGTVLDGGPLDYIGDNTYGLINRNIDLEGLPSGNYVLSVTATDRLGNPTTVSRDIYLEPGIFIDEDTINGCSVGLEGGICDITFDVCVRNVSSMTFAMSKIDTVLSGQISANQLNAMLFVNDNSGKVGQLNEISEGVYEGYEDTRLPEEVDFISQCQIVNGIESFTVSLNFPEGILKSNSGNYNFDYEVKGYNCEQEGFIEPDETPAD